MGGQISSPLNNSVFNVTVQRILKFDNAKVVSVKEDDTLEVALKVLHENKVLSAPVLDKDGKCRKGFFAMDDVVMHLSRIAKQTIQTGSGVESTHLKTDQLEDLVVRKKYFHLETVHDIITRHRGGKQYLRIKANRPVAEALEVFANGVQRLVVQRRKTMIGILSQSTVVKWIAESPKRLGELAEEPALQLGIPWKNLIKIRRDVQTIDAVELMHDKGVYACPIVDENDKLVGHVSMSDFKALALNDIDFTDLLLPLHEFITRVRKANNQDPAQIIRANSNQPFKDIIEILAKEHVHHVYLFNDKGDPVSMLSLTNVCHKIFHKFLKK